MARPGAGPRIMSYWVVIYRVGWLALVVLGVVGASVVFVPKWNEYRDYQRRNSEMAREVALEDEMLKLLKGKQDRFRTDPRFLERIAHDLGLARSNEVLFRIHQDGAPVLPRPPAVTNPPARPAAPRATTRPPAARR